LKILLGVAVLAAIGVLLNVLACVFWDNFIVLLCLVFYFVAPIPHLLCGRLASDDFGSGDDPWDTRSSFFTAAMTVSGFAFPAILAHAGVITVGAMALSMGGSLLIYATIIIYLHVFHKKDNDDF
jgi:hypothetical protein